MSQDYRIDYEIMKAITDGMTHRNLNDTPYANKLKKTIANKLVGKFHESDLLDLIEDIPDFVWDTER